MTTYSYNNAGEQSLIDYADSTADVSFSYDRLGRMTNVVNGAMTTTLYFNSLNQFLGESYSGGVLNGLRVTNSYDALLRRTTNGALNSSTWLTQMRYGYDAASRLKTVGAGTNIVAYSYLANSPLVENVWFTNGSTLRMTTTKQDDYLNRLKQISSTPSAASAITFNYAYNAANQRTAITNADSSRWAYQYDALGQVTSGKKYWSDNTPVAGQQFEYGFDDIGNRNTTASGGDQYGGNLRYAGYTNNTLNQITGRSVPGYVNVIGSATNTATVTVNNQASYRRSNYFRVELTTNNAPAPLWLGVTNVAVLNDGSNPDIVSSVTGNVFLAKSPESYTYDLDGNLTSDSRWTNRWDAENRLIEMEAITSVPAAAKLKLAFAYDYQGRRIQKVVSIWNGSAYVAQRTNRFVYDGWNLIAELNHTNGIVRTYAWGLDLSGSEQGAGGVGGLLQITQPATTNAQLFCAHDGNGNIAALVSATNGTVTANYEYGPFGEVIRVSGISAAPNPFRFSTKYQDDETGLLYYGYRYYDPGTGRWNSRDPLEELGGKNLLVTTDNDVINQVDVLGMTAYNYQLMIKRIKASIAAGEMENAADEAWKLYLALYFDSVVAEFKTPHAREFLRRWLDKTGGTRTLNKNEMKSLLGTDFVGYVIAHRVIAGGLSGKGTTTDFKIPDVTAKEKTDYFYALGWFQLSFTGKYDVNNRTRAVTLNGCFTLADTYDWQKPGNKNITLPTGDVVYDKWAELVENYGRAEPFDVDGNVDMKISGIATGTPPKR